MLISYPGLLLISLVLSLSTTLSMDGPISVYYFIYGWSYLCLLLYLWLVLSLSTTLSMAGPVSVYYFIYGWSDLCLLYLWLDYLCLLLYLWLVRCKPDRQDTYMLKMQPLVFQNFKKFHFVQF